MAFILIGSGQLWAQAKLVDVAASAVAPDGLGLTYAEPSIAVDPADASKIAVMVSSGSWNGDPTNLVWAPLWKSANSGDNWRKVPQIPAPGILWFGPDNDQSIVFDGASRLFVGVLGHK